MQNVIKAFARLMQLVGADNPEKMGQEVGSSKDDASFWYTFRDALRAVMCLWAMDKAIRLNSNANVLPRRITSWIEQVLSAFHQPN